MIPPQFDCVRPRTVEEAVSALAESGNAKLLAGGQSFLPILRLRLAYPDLVVDLGQTVGMWGIRDEGDELVIGAMTTHYEVLASDLVRRHCGLLAKATSTVADPQVRHRGTFGGALSHADPAGDLPAVALAFGTTMWWPGRTAGARCPRQLLRRLPADRAGTRRRARRGSCAQAGRRQRWGYRYEKFQRVAQSWAIVGVAALVRRSGDVIEKARLGLVNMGATPLRATAAEDALAGARADAGAVADAAVLAAEGTRPPSDLSGQADYRRHLARALTQSAVLAAAGIQAAADSEVGFMELQNEFTVPAPVSEVWKTLLDVERIAPCLPGATVDRHEGDEVAGRVNVKVGPITASYAGTARFVTKDESDHRFVLQASGRETRGSGSAAATVEARMSEQESGTHVTVGTSLQISGKQAQFGRGVMAEVAGQAHGSVRRVPGTASARTRRGGRPRAGASPRPPSGAGRRTGGAQEAKAAAPQASGSLDIISTVAGPLGEAVRSGAGRPGARGRPWLSPRSPPPPRDRGRSRAHASHPARACGAMTVS